MHIPSSLCSLPVRRLCNRISYIVGSRVGFSRCSSRFLRVFVASDCLVSVESLVSCFLSVVAGAEGICINKNYCIPIAWCPSYEFRATHSTTPHWAARPFPPHDPISDPTLPPRSLQVHLHPKVFLRSQSPCQFLSQLPMR